MATQDEILEAEEAPLEDEERQPLISRESLRSLKGFLTSMAAHLALVVGLALWVIPMTVKSTATSLVVTSEEPLKDLETAVLDEQTNAATEMTFAEAGGSPDMGAEASDAEDFKEIELDKTLLDDPSGTVVSIDGMFAAVAGRRDLIDEVPQGTPGKGRSVVDGYQEAIDRITREIMLMLYQQKMLVVWCFDQSESMKDDQQDISNRIERVYTELGLSDKAAGDALTTAVTSYGASFVVHTQQPTSNFGEIRAAIDDVPVDPSGEEMMCRAVGQAIGAHKSYAAKTRRRMALILVTDESGNRDGNVQFLEAAIHEAKAARCKIYVLGREAVFGYPYAYFRFRHPQTSRPHWLRIDRGPETAFVEQLQIDGIRRRHDAHPSGFGPYEQSRMARESGGIFFLLPTEETAIVRGQNTLARGENRRYELEAMEYYHPDLRSREEIFRDRERYELRTMLWKIISDLNPYAQTTKNAVEVEHEFSPDRAKFAQQVKENQGKAKVMINYMAQAAGLLEKKAFLRDRETEVRWRANYDLAYGQLLAYQVRLYEYGAYLDQFMQNPPKVPLTKPPNLRLDHWGVRTRKDQLTDESTQKYIDQANEVFAKVARDHPGTPWAARARWEKGRGYGIHLVPIYEPPYNKVSNPTPLPKL